MSEMVERVAKAMHDRRQMDIAPRGNWEDLHFSNRAPWVKLARAAIEAMWEPTEEMYIEFSGDDRAVWQTMVDASLRQPA